MFRHLALYVPFPVSTQRYEHEYVTQYGKGVPHVVGIFDREGVFFITTENPFLVESEIDRCRPEKSDRNLTIGLPIGNRQQFRIERGDDCADRKCFTLCSAHQTNAIKSKMTPRPTRNLCLIT